MIRRLLDVLAPVRPAGSVRGYRRLLRWAAVPITDRRWAAPLAALALGFGLFAGVAIGPGTAGSLATGAPQVIEIPDLLAGGGDEEEEGDAESEEAEAAAAGGSGESAGGSGSEAGSFPVESSASAFIPGFESEAPESTGGEPLAEEEEETEEEAEPEAEAAQVLSGIVVHANPAAGSYTLVETGGLMNAVHAAKLPVPGTKLSVPVRTLANGTFAEAGARQQAGKQARASFAGIVTFVDSDPATPAYAVSKRGTSVLVHVRPDPAGVPSALPQLGAYATVAVGIEKVAGAGASAGQEAAATSDAAAETPAAPAAPQAPADPTAPPPSCAPDSARPLPATPGPVAILWQRQLDADGAPFTSSDFAGVVRAVCPATGQLLLSADDLREGGKDIAFSVPKAIDTRGLVPGDSVAASAEIEAGGVLELTGLASDERTKGADDATATQGDLASHAPK